MKPEQQRIAIAEACGFIKSESIEAKGLDGLLRTLDLWSDDYDEAIIDPRGHEERSMM
jgi:hypothetical protein